MNTYMIEGRHFQDVELAKAFGTRLAVDQRRHIPLLEKVPGLPWHLLHHLGYGSIANHHTTTTE